MTKYKPKHYFHCRQCWVEWNDTEDAVCWNCEGEGTLGRDPSVSWTSSFTPYRMMPWDRGQAVTD